MNKINLSLLALALLVWIVILIVQPWEVRAQAAAPLVTMTSSIDEPAVTNTPHPTRTPHPTATPAQAVQIEPVDGLPLGIPDAIGCWDCNPFTVTIRLSHYVPNEGEINCWDYDEEFHYCMSDMKSGFPWESFWGFAAACPFEWPYGTWVEVPGVGMFICMDRGGRIVCEDGICRVDVLGPGGPWDQEIYEDVTIWVPLRPRKD